MEFAVVAAFYLLFLGLVVLFSWTNERRRRRDWYGRLVRPRRSS